MRKKEKYYVYQEDIINSEPRLIKEFDTLEEAREYVDAREAWLVDIYAGVPLDYHLPLVYIKKSTGETI